MAAVVAENFNLQQGEDFEYTFTLKNSDQTLKNITSYTSTAYMAKYAGDATSYPFTVGITTSTSKIKISMASTITATLDPGRYYYNVFTVDGSSVKRKEREGSIIVNGSVLQ
jgi:hypothetical protein